MLSSVLHAVQTPDCTLTCCTEQLRLSVAVNVLTGKPAELGLLACNVLSNCTYIFMYVMCQDDTRCAGNRAHAEQISGDLMEAASHLSDDSFDAFISTYVLDILSDKDIEAVLRLAHR